MKDIKIEVVRDNGYVYPDKKVLGINGENLQGNIIFELDTFVDGYGYAEIEYEYVHHYEYICNGEETGEYEILGLSKKFTMPTIEDGNRLLYYPILKKLYKETTSGTTEISFTDGTSQNKLTFDKIEKAYYELVKDADKKTYSLPIYNTMLLKEGRLYLQLRINEQGTNNPIFKANKFYLDVNEAINAISLDSPKEYSSWITRLENAITATNNLNLDANKSGSTTTVTITKKDGTVKTVNILDGEDGEGIPTGGTTGQVLKKKSNTDYDTEWSDSAGITNHNELNNLSYANSGHTGFQATISDLETIRSGASAGATAVQDASYVHTDNNYSTTEKTKLSGIEEGATKVEKTSDITNDSNFISDSSYVHTDNNFTNAEKIKLDGIDMSTKEDVFRYSTMPSASASNVGKIVEYTGITGAYTKGYFYECVDASTQESITATQTDSVVSLGTITLNNTTLKSQLSAGTHEFYYRPYDTVLNFMNINAFPPVSYQVTRDNTFDRQPMIPNAPKLYSWVDGNNNFYATDTLSPNALTKLYSLDIQTYDVTDTGATFIGSNTPSQIEGRWTKKEGDVYTDVEISDYGILLSSSGLPGNTISVNYVAANTSYSWVQKDVQPETDISGKQDSTDNNFTTTSKSVTGAVNELKGRIDNIQNIGRFLSIWNCTTGLPTSEPSSLPYTYRTGDYYRVGVVDTTTNYMPNGASYTGTASTTQYTGTETLSIGAVFYYDGSVWRLQASGGGGTVNDVKVNNVSVVTNKIANIDLTGKVDKVAGKGLSTNDYTNADKNLLYGANKAKSYTNYQAMVTELNADDGTSYKVGQTFYIQTLNVPDLWVYSIETTSSTYTYVDDETIVAALETTGYIQVGYYKLSMLETLKQDLSNYYTKTETDTALSSKLGTENIKTINTSSNTDAYACNYINDRINGTVLWTNPHPSSTISTQTITNINLAGWDYLEIWYRPWNTDNRLISTKVAKVNDNYSLNLFEVGVDYWLIRSRFIQHVSDTQLIIKQGYQVIGGNISSSSNIDIPVYIVGFKGVTFN